MIITNAAQLKIPCKRISIFEAFPVIDLLKIELERHKNGVGLAANQIGIDACVCVVQSNELIALINPVIVGAYDLVEFKNEGCLSFPNQYITTKRHNEIFVKDDLHPYGLIFYGFEAVQVEHEVGHLNGETMFDYEIKIPQRNEKCWCGSGIKYKNCHGKK